MSTQGNHSGRGNSRGNGGVGRVSNPELRRVMQFVHPGRGAMNCDSSSDDQAGHFLSPLFIEKNGFKVPGVATFKSIDQMMLQIRTNSGEIPPGVDQNALHPKYTYASTLKRMRINLDFGHVANYHAAIFYIAYFRFASNPRLTEILLGTGNAEFTSYYTIVGEAGKNEYDPMRAVSSFSSQPGGKQEIQQHRQQFSVYLNGLAEFREIFRETTDQALRGLTVLRRAYQLKEDPNAPLLEGVCGMTGVAEPTYKDINNEIDVRLRMLEAGEVATPKPVKGAGKEKENVSAIRGVHNGVISLAPVDKMVPEGELHGPITAGIRALMNKTLYPSLASHVMTNRGILESLVKTLETSNLLRANMTSWGWGVKAMVAGIYYSEVTDTTRENLQKVLMKAFKDGYQPKENVVSEILDEWISHSFLVMGLSTGDVAKGLAAFRYIETAMNVSEALANGSEDQSVAALLGHPDRDTIMRIYTHENAVWLSPINDQNGEVVFDIGLVPDVIPHIEQCRVDGKTEEEIIESFFALVKSRINALGIVFYDIHVESERGETSEVNEVPIS